MGCKKIRASFHALDAKEIFVSFMRISEALLRNRDERKDSSGGAQPLVVVCSANALRVCVDMETQFERPTIEIRAVHPNLRRAHVLLIFFF